MSTVHAAPQRPNLFDFGRSELSQDAFLCWLLAWADRTHMATEPSLHALGRSLLDALFVASATEPPGSCTVQLLQQLDDCDIVALVGESHALIIEDKVDATHESPLEVYKSRIAARYPGRALVCIYLKTGDQHSYESVVGAGWTVLRRYQLLGVLRRGQSTVQSDIFCDYLSRLETIEAETESFRTVAPENWPWRAWSGFYRELQPLLGSPWWGYVANPKGGFMCFTWGWQRLVDGNDLYAQLSQHKLVVKLHVSVPAARSEVRARWVEKVVGEHQGLTFRRPHKLGHGEWMTVAELDSDYRLTDGDGRLDIDRTVSLLRLVAFVVAAVATQPPQ